MTRIKSILPVLFFLFEFLPVRAQEGIYNLIQAEKNFAAKAASDGTRDAFLAFADSTGVVFQQGNVENALQWWTSRPKGPGLLQWFPRFAEISLSGDLGFTSGPWTWRSKSGDSVQASGQYSTVWHKNAKGEWKFLVDLGVETKIISADTSCWIATYSDLSSGSRTKSEILKAEHQLIRATSPPLRKKQKRAECYRPFLSTQQFSLICRNGAEAAWSQDQYYAALDHTDGDLKYKVLYTAIASSGDLGYVYGSVTLKGKTNFYLRVWRHEIRGWKLALDVAAY